MASPPPYPFTLDASSFNFAANSGSDAADAWFGRGIAWFWGFHCEEASRCFTEALRLAPDFAMAAWGLGISHGPFYNLHGARYVRDGLKPSTLAFSIPAALEHAQRARALLDANGGALPLESALVDALLVRTEAFASAKSCATADEFSVAFARSERAYADALRGVLAAHPDDVNVAALFAAALMNLSPWKLWQPTDDTPRELRTMEPDTAEITETLRAGLALCPSHLGLCHLWVHAQEMAPDPAVARPQADILADVDPGGRNTTPDVAHLCHMAAHIYMQLGAYRAAIETSLNAVAADEKLAAAGDIFLGPTQRIRGGFAHNLHELIVAAMWAADLPLARSGLAKLQVQIDSNVRRNPTRMEPFGLMRFHAYIRFGLWREILAVPRVEDVEFFAATHANECYARGVALAALGDVAGAEQEQEALVRARELPILVDEGALSARKLHNIPEQQKLAVAAKVLAGEIAYRKGEFERAFRELREGVRMDDALPFDEPWGWVVPVRHALGALLLERGLAEGGAGGDALVREATAVYEQDLVLHPKNCWALVGLRDCLRAAAVVGGKLAEVEAELAAVVKENGVSAPTASCACALETWSASPDEGGKCCDL